MGGPLDKLKTLFAAATSQICFSQINHTIRLYAAASFLALPDL